MTNQEIHFPSDDNYLSATYQSLLDLLTMTKSQLSLIKDCEELEDETIAAFDQITQKRRQKLEQVIIAYNQDKDGDSAELVLVLENVISEIRAIDAESNNILREKLNHLGQKIGRIASNRKANKAYDSVGAIRSIFVDKMS